MEEKSEQISNGLTTRVKSLNPKDVSPLSKLVMNNNTDEDDEEIDDHSTEIAELNNRIKTDFMTYCLSFLQEDEESRECVQIIWNKYLQCVGDVAMVNRTQLRCLKSFLLLLDFRLFRYTSI
jgi:hypothetical protein